MEPPPQQTANDLEKFATVQMRFPKICKTNEGGAATLVRNCVIETVSMFEGFCKDLGLLPFHYIWVPPPI